MQKYGKWILILIAILAVMAIAYYFFFYKQNNSPAPSTAERLSTEVNIDTTNNTDNSSENKHLETNEHQEPTETELANSSTDILIDDNNRDNNLELTASKINNYIVKKGEEFSFNDVVGNPTPEKGYEKAGIFVNGKKAKGYGGGNCQISSTLYDAVLKVDGLKVTERHGHDKEVGYIRQGRDATVVYDELDLKFENNTEYDIKIYAEVTKNEVQVKIVKLSS